MPVHTDTEIHSDLAHVDEPEHYDWGEHGDWEDTRPAEPHQDLEHEDWPDHINVPSHDDTPHADWSDEHLDTPHEDWSAHGDDPFGAHGDEPPTHDDWWNLFWHNDWGDHFDWSDHSDWPDHGDLAHEDVPAQHYDWGNHGDLPHTDEYPHNDLPHTDWSDTPWSDHGDEEPHDDWGDYAEASHLDHLEHLDYPPEEWEDWEDWPDLPPEEYTLTLRVLEGNGRLCVDGECTRESASFTLLRGTTVIVNAIPDPGWRIKRFTVDGREYSPPYTLHMYNDHTVEVAFERVEAEAEGELVSWRFDTEVKVDTDYDFEFTVRNVGEAGTLVARIYNISGGTIYVSGEGWSYVVPPGDHVWFSMHAEPGETLTVSGKIRYTTPGTNIIRIAAGHEVAGEYKEDQYVDITVNVTEVLPPPTITSFDVKQVGDKEVEARIEWSGGEYPVTVKIGWGDGQVDEIPETDPEVHSISVTHTYKDYGKYVVTAVVVDNLDRVSPGVQKEIVVQAEIELVRWDTRMIGDRHLETEIEFNVEIKRYVLRWGDRGEVLGWPVTPTKVIKEDHVYSWAGQYHLEIEVTDVYDRTAIYGMDVVVEGLMAESDPFEITGIAAPFMGVVAGTYTARVWVEAGKVFLQLINKGTGRVAVSVEASTVAKTWTDTLANLYRQVIDELVELGASADEINKALDAADRAIKEMTPKIQEAIKFNRGAAVDLAEMLKLTSEEFGTTIDEYLASLGVPKEAATASSVLGKISEWIGLNWPKIVPFAFFVAIAAAAIIGIFLEKKFKVRVRIKVNIDEEISDAKLSLYLDGHPMSLFHCIESGLCPYYCIKINGVDWFDLFSETELASLLERLAGAFERLPIPKLKPGENVLEFAFEGEGCLAGYVTTPGKHKIRAVLEALGKTFSAEKEFEL